MPSPVLPVTPLERLVRLVRKIVKGQKYNIPSGLRSDLKRALAAYDDETSGPTAFSFLLDDDAFDEKPANLPVCAWHPCGLTFRPRKADQKFCQSTCRQHAWYEKQQAEQAEKTKQLRSNKKRK